MFLRTVGENGPWNRCQILIWIEFFCPCAFMRDDRKSTFSASDLSTCTCDKEKKFFFFCLLFAKEIKMNILGTEIIRFKYSKRLRTIQNNYKNDKDKYLFIHDFFSVLF